MIKKNHNRQPFNRYTKQEKKQTLVVRQSGKTFT